MFETQRYDMLYCHALKDQPMEQSPMTIDNSSTSIQKPVQVPSQRTFGLINIPILRRPRIYSQVNLKKKQQLIKSLVPSNQLDSIDPKSILASSTDLAWLQSTRPDTSSSSLSRMRLQASKEESRCNTAQQANPRRATLNQENEEPMIVNVDAIDTLMYQRPSKRPTTAAITRKRLITQKQSQFLIEQSRFSQAIGTQSMVIQDQESSENKSDIKSALAISRNENVETRYRTNVRSLLNCRLNQRKRTQQQKQERDSEERSIEKMVSSIDVSDRAINNRQRLFQLQLQQLNKIQSGFLQTLQGEAKDSARARKQPVLTAKTLLTSNRMIPMSDYTTIQASHKRESTLPVKLDASTELNLSLEKAKASVDNHLYQVYLAEVKALNTVKIFLRENYSKLSIDNRESLIAKIRATHKKLKGLEKELIMQF
ncbi:hypothetical protein FGO68_gene415 [Halteria grandinella]|uniref:Uncharacterized protein n=1 Tax=Halteria grandinella TaxID=5974 RepID=A0A8J8NRY8_HALGN|nr:hypothetical protein FGO68_gene415 [Halteria grandinella]